MFNGTSAQAEPATIENVMALLQELMSMESAEEKDKPNPAGDEGSEETGKEMDAASTEDEDEKDEGAKKSKKATVKKGIDSSETEDTQGTEDAEENVDDQSEVDVNAESVQEAAKTLMKTLMAMGAKKKAPAKVVAKSADVTRLEKLIKSQNEQMQVMGKVLKELFEGFGAVSAPVVQKSQENKLPVGNAGKGLEDLVAALNAVAKSGGQNVVTKSRDEVRTELGKGLTALFGGN